MTTALIVGGDQIDGIKQVLASHGIDHIKHWSGRKVGDGKKVIPQDTDIIVMVTDWISHNFTHKIKQAASKRGLRIVYTPNGPAALSSRLARIDMGTVTEAECRSTIDSTSFVARILDLPIVRRWSLHS